MSRYLKTLWSCKCGNTAIPLTVLIKVVFGGDTRRKTTRMFIAFYVNIRAHHPTSLRSLKSLTILFYQIETLEFTRATPLLAPNSRDMMLPKINFQLSRFFTLACTHLRCNYASGFKRRTAEPQLQIYLSSARAPRWHFKGWPIYRSIQPLLSVCIRDTSHSCHNQHCLHCSFTLLSPWALWEHQGKAGTTIYAENNELAQRRGKYWTKMLRMLFEVL